MPHCDKDLYEGVLKSIWNPKDLSKFLIIGNDLSLYNQT